jgi:hypothetical protein
MTEAAAAAAAGAGADATALAAIRANVTTGELGVLEIMQDDVADKFPVQVSLTGASASGSGPLDAPTKELMRLQGAEAVRAALRGYADELLAFDGGQEALALDAKRRAEEAAKRDEAVASKGEEKERIAEAQKAKEAQRKQEELERQRAAAAMAPQPVSGPQSLPPQPVVNSASSATVAGTGSVWNANSYHWEEKPLTPWAKERLSALLKGVDIDIPGGTVKVVEASLSGDAAISIRKGKKLIFFDFKVVLTWEGELLDSEGVSQGTGDGEVVILDLDQDSDLDRFRMDFKAAEDGGASDKRLKALFEQHGVAAIRGKIKQFVDELKAK